jgi:hypothetical protein
MSSGDWRAVRTSSEKERDLSVAKTTAGGYGRDINVTIEFGARRDSNALGTLRPGNFI